MTSDAKTSDLKFKQFCDSTHTIIKFREKYAKEIKLQLEESTNKLLENILFLEETKSQEYGINKIKEAITKYSEECIENFTHLFQLNQDLDVINSTQQNSLNLIGQLKNFT